jgi:hypothetical protein
MDTRSLAIDTNFEYYKSLTLEEQKDNKKLIIRFWFVVLTTRLIFIPLLFLVTFSFKECKQLFQMVPDLGYQGRGQKIHEKKMKERKLEWEKLRDS